MAFTESRSHRVLRSLAVAIPALTLLLVTPFAWAAILDDRAVTSWWIVVPWGAGLLALPGVLAALVSWPDMRAASRRRRLAVRGSFLLGLVASLLGAVLSLFTLVGPVLAFASFAVTLVSWRTLEAKA